MATPPTQVTVSGTPVEFLPLSTPWPSGDGCAANIYRQLDGHFVAWDPFYGMSINTDARTCFPPEVTTWWFQKPSPPTYTALGPTFVCPEAYSAVQTALVARESSYIYCCPSQYSLLVPQPTEPVFPSQCVSQVTRGQSISYINLFVSNGVTASSVTTTTIESSAITIFGVPVNGFDLSRGVTATETTAAAAETATATSEAQHNSGAASAPPASNASSGSSVAVSVGASIGVVFVVLAILFGCWVWWRRRRRRNRDRAGSTPGMSVYANRLSGTSRKPELHGEEVPPKYELSGESFNSKTRVYELPGDA